MKYFTIPPSAELSQIINFFWVFEGAASEAKPFTMRTMASGFPELIFHYKGTFDEVVSDKKLHRSFTSGIHAQTNRHRDFSIRENFAMIGVQLYPYVIDSLFGHSSAEILNELPDLSEIKNTKYSALQDQVFQSENHTEQINLISRFVTDSIQKPQNPAVVFAVNTILAAQGTLDIQKLASNCFLSQRQFERVFKAQVGFSPKYFSRLIRFKNTVSSKKRFGSLTELSHAFGYFDQSHFISEFKEFSGKTPKEHFNF